MGTIVQFRSNPDRSKRSASKSAQEKETEWGVVIIFPGIRRERHSQDEDYLSAEENIDDAAHEDGAKQGA